MRTFRPPPYRCDILPGKPGELTLADIRRVLDLVFAPHHFFLGPGIELKFEHKSEEISWEIFKGRLLEPAHTRICQEFESWSAYWVEGETRSEEPIIALKLDTAARQIHVVRAIYSYVWEGFDDGSNVIESREITRWVRELVGTIHLGEFQTGGELMDEIVCLIFQAVVGTGRLPLTSLESPLPAFTLGRLLYFFGGQSRIDTRPTRSIGDLIRSALISNLARREEVKLLETVLRATSQKQLSNIAKIFVGFWKDIGHSITDLSPLLRELFDEVSLSPYTDFVKKTLEFVGLLEGQGTLTTSERIDFLSWLLRRINRHLTAFDLRTFHHRGANYPDALLLDAILKVYLQAIEDHPALFFSDPDDPNSMQLPKRRRRRALRQGWLLRRWYEGLPIPDFPTSPGENRRVLPGATSRLPDEQILQPEKRSKRLFDRDKFEVAIHRQTAALLRESLADLQHPEELQELGMAIFLDRPLGTSKNPGEPDQTPLLSYLAFSRFIAQTRLTFLADIGLLKDGECEALAAELRHMDVRGVSPLSQDQNVRPGSVSISDATRSAPDFMILRTTKKSVGQLMEFIPFDDIDPRVSPRNWPGELPFLIMRGTNPNERIGPLLDFYDRTLTKRLEWVIDTSQGFSCRAGVELPRAGLRLLRAWTANGDPVAV